MWENGSTIRLFHHRLLLVFVNVLLGLSTTKNFTIVVRDRNDPPTSLTASAPLSVYENSLSGEYIGSLTTADQDVAQTHQYKIVDVVARGHRTERYGMMDVQCTFLVTSESF